jgi:16S rRNA (adenine1518-N6/adenine1519-N6)-dimethyltransferase
VGRRLGQHFLKRGSVLARIAEAACPDPSPLVIEIGPGRGALTRYLAPKAERLIAIEADAALVEHLRGKFADTPNLTVIHGDVLSTDLAQWGPAVVVGNLPYYITSPILRRTLAMGERLLRAVFLVQKEVAQRLVAAPGSREYGLLSVLTQMRAEAEVLFTVPPAAFAPPPKVDSAAVRLQPRRQEAPWLSAGPGFEEFLGICFRQKRKTLRNNLSASYDRRLLAEIPATALRAEQMPVEELYRIYRQLASAKR